VTSTLPSRSADAGTGSSGRSGVGGGVDTGLGNSGFQGTGISGAADGDYGGDEDFESSSEDDSDIHPLPGNGGAGGVTRLPSGNTGGAGRGAGSGGTAGTTRNPAEMDRGTTSEELANLFNSRPSLSDSQRR